MTKQKQINLRLLMLSAPAIMAMVVISRFHSQPRQVDSNFRMIMGTFARILVIAPNRSTGYQAIEAGFQQMQLVDGLMSTYRPDSELSIVNEEAYQRPIPVSPQTYTVLEKAIETSKLSQGAFDITIAPLLELWHSAADTNTPPLPEQIAEAKGKVGWEKLELDPNEHTVRFKVPGMKLDLGGIAKGYAIDLAIQAVRDANALGAMVDIGGDIRCFGRPPNGKKHWRIGLQDPRVAADDTQEKYVLVLACDNVAVATSGHYRRFSLINGQPISHILEPDTGQSSHKLASTTVIAPTAITADALATAVTVLGQEKGLALIETLPDVESIVIPDAGSDIEFQQTSGAEAFVADDD